MKCYTKFPKKRLQKPEISINFCLEETVRKKQDYLFISTVAPTNLLPERPEKSCSIYQPNFQETFCKW